MTKVKPSTKEQLIHYLLGNISLGTYDRKFLVNLETSYLTNKKPVTTNQANLLEKIVLRYKRQLAKQEVSSDEANALPWTREPIPSLPEFTETHLLLVDDELILRSPYKSAFLKDFKKLDIHSKWEADDRLWRIPATTYTLKIVKECIERHYNTINYCEYIQDILKPLETYTSLYLWNPTFKYINGNFYVVSVSTALSESIKDLSFDIDLSNLARIAARGIEIDNTVIQKYKETYTEKQIQFAIDLSVKIDIGDHELVDLIATLKPDLVVFSEYVSSVKPFFSVVKEKLNMYNMSFVTQTYTHNVNLSDYDYIIIVESGLSLKHQILPYVSKLVQVVNSKPINIK